MIPLQNERKKNPFSPKNTNKNYLFLLPYLIIPSVIILFIGRTVADNAVLRSIFSCQAQGLGGKTPTVDIWYQQGTNLSFIPAGETIKKVWLNDPSQVTIDFDGPMCMQFGQDRNINQGDCQNSAAHVIQLRRIPKLNIPGLPDTKNTLLTVVTEAQGKTKLYAFRVIYHEGNPEYSTLAIFADPPSPDPSKPICELPKKTPNQ
jgi:hypothetical protein